MELFRKTLSHWPIFRLRQLAFILATVVQISICYKPVILLHGVLDNGRGLADIQGYIQNAHPGTNVTSLELYDDLMSVTSLDLQLDDFINKVRPIMKAAPDGVNLICHSQCGLICRGIVEVMEDHNVVTLITLSSPLLGQFGIPPSWLKYLPELQNKTREEPCLYVVFPRPSIDRKLLASFFEYLSSDTEKIVPVKEQLAYVDDWFGLRTLDERGGLTRYIVNGIEHQGWHHNITIFNEFIEKWLD